MIDQRRLPAALNVVKLFTHIEGMETLKTMAVRGAPAINGAATYGFA
jgi:methylthioribose-1-phosphate isomerase